MCDNLDFKVLVPECFSALDFVENGLIICLYLGFSVPYGEKSAAYIPSSGLAFAAVCHSPRPA